LVELTFWLLLHYKLVSTGFFDPPPDKSSLLRLTADRYGLNMVQASCLNHICGFECQVSCLAETPGEHCTNCNSVLYFSDGKEHAHAMCNGLYFLVFFFILHLNERFILDYICICLIILQNHSAKVTGCTPEFFYLRK
jgi:hypothetical protein